MNYVYLSPHFPPNYHLFCVHLRRLGVNVLGLADEPREWLSPAVREGLTEYYRVKDMHSYDQLVRACGYFTHHYGKLDRVDSHTEYWLESEARLRSDFNIPGPKLADMASFKRKSLMKQAFIQAGVPTAAGVLVRTLEQAQAFRAADRLSARRQAGHRRRRGEHLQARKRRRTWRASMPPSRRWTICWRSSSTARSTPLMV